MPREELRVAALIMGRRHPPHWTEPATPDVDEWDAKALAESIARSVADVEGSRARQVDASAAAVECRPVGEDGVLWRVLVRGEERGLVRRLALDAPVWAPPAYGVELLLMPMFNGEVAPPGEHRATEPDVARVAQRWTEYRELPTTPASEFDLALLVPNDMPAARVEAVIRRAAGELLERVALFDEYRGAGVPDGVRSLAWRLTFRHPERTLRDKEIAGRREKLLRTLEGELGVRQRTA